MEQKNVLDSGFTVNNIILLESEFKRVTNVVFDNDNMLQDIKVDVNVQIIEKIVAVTESITYTQTYEGLEQVKAIIKMVGLFEKYGEAEIDLDSFGKINGAAILFPYIREHLTNLTAKAGLGLVILPPMNFTNKPDKD
jgi:preprotein translocase subunit SecB